MSAVSAASVPAVRLSTTSYLVLGLIALRGPSTPYRLKRAVGRSVGYFWSFPHSQLYEEPARLARAGLLAEEREEGGRRRRVYALTGAGREALRAWLRDPTDEGMELRDTATLKLFFSELVTADDVVALARSQVAYYRQLLAHLEAVDARYVGYPELARRMAPLTAGLRLFRAMLGFWEGVAAQPPGEERVLSDER